MRAPDGSFMEISISVQKKTRVCKKTTPLQAIASARSGSRSRTSYNEPVEIAEKASRVQRTTMRCETAEPVWDERFTFNVPKEQLLNVCFDILVYNGERAIGGLRLGHAASYRPAQHWAKMINKPKVWVFYSYMLQ